MDDLLSTLSKSNLLIIGTGLLGGLLGLAFSYKEIVKIVRIMRTQSGVIGTVNQISTDEFFETTGKAESGTTLQSPITKTACL